MPPATPGATKSSLPAVIGAGTRVLILGSLPGEVSLRRAQYYAHPRNQFWRLIGAAIQCDLAALPYPARLAALRAAGVGVWDVIRSAERHGSLDSNIRRIEANALRDLLTTLPALRAVCFNGQKAAQIGRPQLADEGRMALVTLPSSSPAHAIPFETKLMAWSQIGPLLDAPPATDRQPTNVD